MSSRWGPNGLKTRSSSMAGTTRFTHVDSHAEWILNILENIDTNPDQNQNKDNERQKVAIG